VLLGVDLGKGEGCVDEHLKKKELYCKNKLNQGSNASQQATTSQGLPKKELPG